MGALLMLELPGEPPWCTLIGRYAVKSYQSEHDSLPAVEKERLRAFLMWLSRQWALTGRLGDRNKGGAPVVSQK